MKTLKNLFAAVLLVSAFLFQSCEKKDLVNPSSNNGILPDHFKIDLPSSISNENATTTTTKAATSDEQTASDTLMGDAIYRNLNTFIAVGEGGADIVEHIIGAIALYNINKPMQISFVSNDDQRMKDLVVKANADFENRTWEFMLTIYDQASESDADSGKAIQVFWNTNPIEGIAILRPYNIDRVHDKASLDAKVRVDYSEAGTDTYDKTMMVEISGYPMPDPRINPYALNSLKMFVGKKGDIVDVYGNSDHPNAKFFTDRTGFSWSFVASGYDSKNIAVAEVGLPPSSLDTDDRNVILKDYSIKNVLTTEINQWFLDTYSVRPDSTDLAGYLKNADAPGYFSNHGFVQGGTAPSSDYAELESRIDQLSPYNPSSVDTLDIQFK